MNKESLAGSRGSTPSSRGSTYRLDSDSDIDGPSGLGGSHKPQKQKQVKAETDQDDDVDIGGAYSEEEEVVRQLEREEANRRGRTRMRVWSADYWRQRVYKRPGSKNYPQGARSQVVNDDLQDGFNPHTGGASRQGRVWRMFRSIVRGFASPTSLVLPFLMAIAIFGGVHYAITIMGVHSTTTSHSKPAYTSSFEFSMTERWRNAWESWKPEVWGSTVARLARAPEVIKFPGMPTFEYWTTFWKRERSCGRDQTTEDSIRAMERFYPWKEHVDRKFHDFDIAIELLHKRASREEHRVSRVEDDVGSLKRYIKDGEWIDSFVLNLLARKIPEYVGVVRDPHTGEIHVPPAFWNQARELFVTRDQMENIIENTVDSSLYNKRHELWSAFLEENEKTLERIVDGRVAKVSSQEFLKLLKTEANAIWAVIKERATGLLESEGKLEASEIWTSRGNGPVPLDSRSLTDIEYQVISDLIDEKLERYSADVVAKPDYALHSAGGRIIPDMTSSDASVGKLRILGRLGLKYFFTLTPLTEKSATKVIQPDVRPGEGWCMNGTQGHIGITLARRIIVTEVTIEHLDPRVAFDEGSAPREIEIWRLISLKETGHEQRRQMQQQEEPHSPNGQQDTEDNADGYQDQNDNLQETKGEKSRRSPVMGTWARDGSPAQGAALLTTVEYQLPRNSKQGRPNKEEDYSSASDSRRVKLAQTFLIPLSMQNVPAYGVYLKVNSNWGHSVHTCLYRVRVHGYEPTHST
ncbi:hypothetical protein BC939DRAFT_515184 [Gamsiella multidivaricata]|uniref:uncharacterized protein n=1 Tax=Gamsiella multidivaricata TaxID=101098 RepID=UPI00221F74BD|nr:uncharacterized protein BC939DRAFT_515184 [Gamsiella multidivaricata]KAI7825348.1 hypothetical protein BC939DRAFT_515184 [Gamsiella multidivaricata]